MNELRTVRWTPGGRAVEILDQTRLPDAEIHRAITDANTMADAIRTLAVRGAPAIGIAAALTFALEAETAANADPDAFRTHLDRVYEILVSARPTGANLRWALDRMRARAAALPDATAADVARALRQEATAILDEDRIMCQRIGEHGLALLPQPAGVMTHCNAGALATGGIGTALAPLYLAHAAGRQLRVYANETRPLLQGSRLTTWELGRAGIEVTLVVDSVAGALMNEGKIDLVIVGADRIAANGDVANKVGTYALSVLARHHGIPFYVAAPASTIDPATPTGADIPIEERDPAEVTNGFGRVTAPARVSVYAPAFDVTPAGHITAIITDAGVLRPPYEESIARLSAVAKSVS